MNSLSRFLAVLVVMISACGGNAPTSVGPVSVRVSPDVASVDIGGTQRFTATVTGSTHTEVAWTLSGAGCAGVACGAIDAAGLYVAPDDLPTPATFTVTATALADATKSAGAGVTVTATTNARFNGTYAFLFNGFELTNIAVAIAGSFTVDGNGGVLGGVLDLNRTDGVRSVPVTGGSYSFGADNRGRLNLITGKESLFFRFAMTEPNGPNHNGRMICFQPGDASRLTGSGVIKKQTPTALSISAFSGDFAARFSGELGSRNPVGAVGRFTLNGLAGTVTGTIDLNLTGTSYPNAATPGTYSSINATTGRGLARLSFPLPIGELNFSFYIVSPVEAFFLGVDGRDAKHPLLSGPMLKQSGGPFTPASMTGGLVLNATGLTGSGSDVTIGRFETSSATRRLFGKLDKNAAGTIIANKGFTGEYDIAANGRGTLNSHLGTANVPYAFYMIGPNRAFLMESEAPEAGSGWIEAQSGGPFTTASLAGNYVVGTATPAECGCTSISGVVTLNGSAGTFLGSWDKSKPDGLFPRDTWAGTFEVPAGTDGRGTMTAETPSVENSVLYVISPNKLVLINAESTFNVSVVTVLEK
jgi:hypothetical protein